MHTILRYAGTVAAVFLTINLIPGVTVEGGWVTILFVALAWSVVVIVIRPLLSILTLPLTIITFGLFALVLNAFLFYALQWVVPGFVVEGFFAAFLGAIVLSILSWLIDRVL